MKSTYFFLAAAFLALPSFAQAQTAGSAEDVQIRSVNFDTQVLELFNFGSSSQALDGWRFCTHDELDGFDYSAVGGLNGFSIAAGSSLSVHWNDDASSPDAVNISTIGGVWIDDLTAAAPGDGISLNLYRDSSFGSAASIIDHVQYSFDGANVGAPANSRGGVAVSAGLWDSTDDWVSVSDDSTGLVLADDPFPGATGGTHSSASYSVTAVPEPSTLLALALGAVGIAARRRRIG